MGKMKKKSVILAVVPLLNMLLPMPTRAQVVAPAGMTLFNKNVMVRCFTRVDLFTSPAPGLTVRGFAFPCAVVWGFHRDTNLIVVAPFAVQDINRRVDGTLVETSRAGFADGLVLVRYDGFYKKNARKGFSRLGGQFGVRLPTGRSGFTSDAVGYVFTAIFSHVRDRNWLVADWQFTLTTTNGSGIKEGNRWNYDVAYLRRMTPIERRNLFVVLEVNGEIAKRTSIRETPVVNSGGNLLFLSPGVEFLPTRRLVLEFSAPIPVVRNLNGAQLRPRFSLVGGLRYLF